SGSMSIKYLCSGGVIIQLSMPQTTTNNKNTGTANVIYGIINNVIANEHVEIIMIIFGWNLSVKIPLTPPPVTAAIPNTKYTKLNMDPPNPKVDTRNGVK